MAKGTLPSKDELMEMGIISAGAALSGAGAYYLNAYAADTNSKTGKQNIAFLANYPYIAGFGIAAVGFVIAQFLGKNQMIENFGFGMLAGGIAEGVVELMLKYNVKA
ncbi:MAG: hypothetical protein OH363_04925 [Candidatus Parvarchaeota archaeon]|nr:hypothetical protein [Candidatus Jingweiarchaeum tengchongense]